MKVTTKIIIVLSLLFLAFASSAQKKEMKIKFGKISDEEIKMTSYKAEPDAPAVILYNKCVVYYIYSDQIGWTQIREYQKRIKILKKEAYDVANVSFSFYKKAFIENLKGSTYNIENGKTIETKLDNDNIFTEQLSKTRSVKKFTMPAVREGSIIEYKYTIRYENAADLPDWYFQDIIPTVWSEFEAEVPEMVSYKKMSQGSTPFLVSEDVLKTDNFNVLYRETEASIGNTTEMHNVRVNFNKNAMRYVQVNIPSVKIEKYTNSPYDAMSRILFQINAIYNTRFQSMGADYSMQNTTIRDNKNSWQDISKEIYEDTYSDYIESYRNLDDNTVASLSKLPTDKEKVSGAMDYFVKNFQTNLYDFIYPSQTPKELATTHKGSPTDLNLYFISYLKKLGLKVYPVLLSTRKNGRVLAYYPSIYSFNRVVTAVILDEKEVFIDASEANSPLGLLPYETTGSEGLMLINKNETKWIVLENKVITRNAITANLKINPTGELGGTLAMSKSGYEASSAREIYKKDGETKLIQAFLQEIVQNGTIKDKKFENLDKWREPNVKANFTLNTKSSITISEEKIYLSPTLNLSINKNPFKETSRTLNIDMGVPSEEILNYIYEIPSGYKLEAAPKSARMTFGDNAISFEYLVDTATPNQVKVAVRYKLKKTQFSAEEYADLRTFYTNIVSKMNEQIVFGK